MFFIKPENVVFIYSHVKHVIIKLSENPGKIYVILNRCGNGIRNAFTKKKSFPQVDTSIRWKRICISVSSQTLIILCVGLNSFSLSLSTKNRNSADWIVEPSSLQEGIHDICFWVIFVIYHAI